MHTPAFASFLPLMVRKRPYTATTRIYRSRRALYYACQSPESKPVPSEPAPLARRETIPSLFRGPEAVLGIVIAAAALLADFSRSLVRLVSRPRPPLKSAHDLDESITLLSSALDASKMALADTENRLDESLARASTAEAALLGIGDTREAMRRARETTQDAEAELQRIARLLVEQRTRFEDVAEEKSQGVGKRDQYEQDIRDREIELEKLRALVAEAQATEQQVEATYKVREEELRGEMQQKEKELEEVRAERIRAETQATDLEARAEAVIEQAEAAEFALEETRKELERVQMDLESRRQERELVEAEHELATERYKESVKLRKKVSDMEREVSELQAELRSRDQVVNEFAMESDELRSLLHARDAELRDINSRLESAMAADAEKGGDSSLSEMSLDEVQRNLDAEKLALSAEITKAELASFELSEDDLDPLERIKKEMGAEKNLLQAGLRKAESTVRTEELLDARKEDAVDDVLQSLDVEIEETSSSDGEDDATAATPEATTVADLDSAKSVAQELTESDADAVRNAEPMIAKQAQVKKEETEAKPRRRRGRLSKNGGTTTASADATQETKPRRKRGRPRTKRSERSGSEESTAN